MGGAIPLLLLHTFVAWTGTAVSLFILPEGKMGTWSFHFTLLCHQHSTKTETWKISSPYNRSRRPREGVEVQLYSFLNLGARWGGWSTPRPGRFTPEQYPVPIVQEAKWAPGPVWADAENLAPTGIRSSDRPACRQPLYRLSYRAHQ